MTDRLTDGLERRRAPEFRATGRKLEGYAAIFDKETRIGDFSEVIAPGAFSASLGDGSDILALVDHDPAKLLGRSKNGTLRLSEDARGLAFSLDVPDTQAGNDALELARRGDLGGMSFAFKVARGGERWQGMKRELRSVVLKEISVVSAWPAYEGTEVNVRKFSGAAPHQKTPRKTLALRFLETV